MQLKRIFEHSFPQMLVPLAANIVGNDELEKFFEVKETQTTEEDVIHVDVSSRDVVMKAAADKVTGTPTVRLFGGHPHRCPS